MWLAAGKPDVVAAGVMTVAKGCSRIRAWRMGRRDSEKEAGTYIGWNHSVGKGSTRPSLTARPNEEGVINSSSISNSYLQQTMYCSSIRTEQKNHGG